MKSQEEALSRKIVKCLWPDVKLEARGSSTDKQGIDAWLGRTSVQIKYDRRIRETGNIYDEYWEKDKGCPWQEWRRCKRKAEVYIFTSGGDLKTLGAHNSDAILVTKTELGHLESDRKMVAIPTDAPTSKGFLIPLPQLINPAIKHIPPVQQKGTAEDYVQQSDGTWLKGSYGDC